jgi:hypothetical protein
MMAPAPESPFAGAHAAAGFAWRGGPRLKWESEAVNMCKSLCYVFGSSSVHMEPKNWSTISKYRNVPEEEHLKPGVVVQSQVLPGKPEVLDRISKTNSVHVSSCQECEVFQCGKQRKTNCKKPTSPPGGPSTALSLQASERIVGPWHHDAQQADYPSIASTSSASPHLVMETQILW